MPSRPAPARLPERDATPEPFQPAPARLPGTRDEASPLPPPTWAARTGLPLAADAAGFLDSLPVDRRLLVQDLRATAAHVDALHRAGLLDTTERQRLMQEIEALSAAPEAFPFEGDEDVHSAVERVLTERLGPLGAKVHAGRSRNDLVATDLRLWVKDAAAALAGKARAMASVLADRAEEHAGTIVPGYTHLQRAQPVTLGHHLLAHAFPLLRDAGRLDRASESADVSPLGAGALATSTLGLDPAATAAGLGMAGAFENSIDAVSDRDFALDLLAACTITAVHLSRLAEDAVLWCSQEFGFATPSDEHATGSSMMPHKRNPDVAELARGKAGRILGDLVRLVTVLKGLPLAYDRDLQEDKEAVFDAHDALAPALEAMASMIRGLTFHPERMAAAASDPALLTTDIAERLVRDGVPFREAHAAVAGVVKRLEDEGRTLGDVKPDEWADLDPRLGQWVEDLLDPERSVAARTTPGGPSAASIEAQLASVRAHLR
ncbi:MAG TPA: argininosuccinate lyase [Actinomycetota bacterium]